MSAPTFPLASPGVTELQAAAGERPATLRTLAAIVLLAALGVLTATSLLASGAEWSVGRAREYAPPATHSGPIDPNC